MPFKPRSVFFALRWLFPLALLVLPACAAHQSDASRHQYSIVRYHDSLTDFHEYRTPARESVAYSARTSFSGGLRADFQPVSSDELDDGDIEATPEALREPALYPTLSLLRPIQENIRVTSPFGVRKHPHQAPPPHARGRGHRRKTGRKGRRLRAG